MPLHPLLMSESFSAIRTGVRLLTVVYRSHMASKMLAPPKPSPTHRTDVGFLAIVCSPNVYNEISFQCKVFTTVSAVVWFLTLVHTPDVMVKITPM